MNKKLFAQFLAILLLSGYAVAEADVDNFAKLVGRTESQAEFAYNSAAKIPVEKISFMQLNESKKQLKRISKKLNALRSDKYNTYANKAEKLESFVDANKTKDAKE